MAIINQQLNKVTETPKRYNATVNSFLGDVDANGVLLAPTVPADVVFTGVKGIGFWSAYLSVLSYAFIGLPTIKTATFPDLDTLNKNRLLGGCFSNCTGLTSVSFPALTSTSFGSNLSQFENMLSGCTGVTVHFPSNLQSVIGSWTDVVNGFGGTNTTVLFDLPATN